MGPKGNAQKSKQYEEASHCFDVKVALGYIFRVLLWDLRE